MKVKNSKVMIGFVTCLVLVSSISVFTPIIIHYTSSYNKNSILLSTANNYTTQKLLSNKYSQDTNTLINNLTYINKYINSTLIIKEKRLRLSILGGKYDKSVKYKNDKNKRSSELARFSHAIKHVHRYADQVQATIDNSTTSLAKESTVISQIITAVQDHPYTYNFYLNKMKVSIPNISFFLSNYNLSSSNNLNSKISDISNNSYGVRSNNTNLNSIAFNSEEDVVSGQELYSGGSSVWNAAFKKITFQAQIITFNKISNCFEYETPTAKESTESKSSASTQLNSKNTEILNDNSLNTNNSSYFNQSQTELSVLNSVNNTLKQNLPTPLAPNYLPGYFNTQVFNAAEAIIKYKHISSFKHNHSLYYPLIFSLALIIGIPSGVMGAILVRSKYKKSIVKGKAQLDSSYDIDFKIDQLFEEIDTPNVSTLKDVDYTAYVHDIDTRILSIKTDIAKNPLSKSNRIRLTQKFNNTINSYDEKTFDRRQQLHLAIVTAINPTVDHIPQSNSLTDTQNTNNAKIENLIIRYFTNENDVKQKISGIDTEHALMEYKRLIIEPYDIELTKLNNDTNYVSGINSITLKTKLEGIINNINSKCLNRKTVIKARIINEKQRIDDLTRKSNKEKSVNAIKQRTAQINSLDGPGVTTEHQLDINAEIIQKQLIGTVQFVSQKEYHPDDVDELNTQANKLQELFDTKVASARVRIRQNSEAHIIETVKAYRIEINKLGKLDNRANLNQTAKRLINGIPRIKELVAKSVYFDDETHEILIEDVASLNKLIDTEVTNTLIKIQSTEDMRNMVQNIRKDLRAVEYRLENEPKQLKDMDAAREFVISMEKQITPIVEVCMTNLKIIRHDILIQFDKSVRLLRTGYKRVYEIKSKQFKEETGHINVDISQKQKELAWWRYRVRTGKDPANNKQLNVDEIKAANTNVNNLERDIKKLHSQQRQRSIAELDNSNFRFTDGITNIIEQL